MLIRGIFLITFALCIDFLQFALGWVAFAVGTGLQAITPVGGAAGGAALGAYACFNTTNGLIQGITDAVVCGTAGGVFGAAISAFGMPIGVLLGFIFDICLSLTLGAGLIFLLALMGMFYPKYVWSAGIFEVMPGFDVLPGWTVMVVLCLIKKRGEEGKAGVTTTAAKIISAVGGASLTNPVSAMTSANTFRQTANQIQSNTRPSNDNQKDRAPLNLKSPSMNDITPTKVPRAANDNLPYVQKAA